MSQTEWKLDRDGFCLLHHLPPLQLRPCTRWRSHVVPEENKQQTRAAINIASISGRQQQQLLLLLRPLRPTDMPRTLHILA